MGLHFVADSIFIIFIADYLHPTIALNIATVFIIHRQLNGTNTVNSRRKDSSENSHMCYCSYCSLPRRATAYSQVQSTQCNLGSHVHYAPHKHQHSVSNTLNEFTQTG